MKERKRKLFITFNDEVAGHLIAKAKQRIIWAAPSISMSLAIDIVAQTAMEPTVAVKVVIDPEYDALQLGYGELSGIKHLRDYEIEVRSERGLRMGILLVDDRCWIFSPTPRIVEEQPLQGDWNGLVVNRQFARWLLYAMAPEALARDLVNEEFGYGRLGRDVEPTDDEDEDEVLNFGTLDSPGPESAQVAGFDFEPEIGEQMVSEAQMAAIEQAHEERPPKIFDHQKELLVYSSYFQFVELHVNGGRLTTKKVKLPQHLIDVTANSPARIEIEASCQLFENSDVAFPDLRMLNKRINDLRRAYLVVLGDDYGSVILRKRLSAFEEEVGKLQSELLRISIHLEERVDAQIAKAKERVIEALKPLILENPPEWLMGLSANDMFAQVRRTLDECFPKPKDVIRRFGLTYVRKDVTWEMLNDQEFLNLLKEYISDAGLVKLYDEATALPEGREPRPEIPDEVLWPEEIGEEDV